MDCREGKVQFCSLENEPYPGKHRGILFDRTSTILVLFFLDPSLKQSGTYVFYDRISLWVHQ